MSVKLNRLKRRDFDGAEEKAEMLCDSSELRWNFAQFKG
jgi:hypothetical protein